MGQHGLSSGPNQEIAGPRGPRGQLPGQNPSPNLQRSHSMTGQDPSASIQRQLLMQQNQEQNPGGAMNQFPFNNQGGIRPNTPQGMAAAQQALTSPTRGGQSAANKPMPGMGGGLLSVAGGPTPQGRNLQNLSPPGPQNQQQQQAIFKQRIMGRQTSLPGQCSE